MVVQEATLRCPMISNNLRAFPMSPIFQHPQIMAVQATKSFSSIRSKISLASLTSPHFAYMKKRSLHYLVSQETTLHNPRVDLFPFKNSQDTSTGIENGREGIANTKIVGENIGFPSHVYANNLNIGSSGGGDGFEVTKFGHGRVALIGFPSVGKSTLLTMLTGTHSEAASYEFTTLTCIPGIIHYNDTKIQLLDLPGIIEGASEGKGRGRQVIAVAKSSDIVLMVLDASKSEGHRQILTKELEAVGLRLNKKPPQIYFKKKKTGGISFNSTLTLTHVDEKLCYQILHEYKIHNAELLFREDATVDDLIDVIVVCVIGMSLLAVGY
ncbi:hypothetical protein C1H46_028454 [Malus baccata]|uniref:OBG-type G domain-containing protein n=1 Tax=Malus baccata TaxID=106549 RepID=A0A540LHM5_MALBA|nr:hypothetical protein C1H46_028454 [Malus baccata]